VRAGSCKKPSDGRTRRRTCAAVVRYIHVGARIARPANGKNGETMKKIFEKPHSLLFTAAAVIFLQFMSGLVYYYAQLFIFREVNDLSYYFYIPYCVMICAAAAAVTAVSKVKAVKLWFAGFSLYALSEIVYYIVMVLTQEVWFGERESTQLTFAVHNAQPFYRLFLCAAMILLIYCAMFFGEKRENREKKEKNKKIFIVFAGMNLLASVLLLTLMFISGAEYFLFYGDENALMTLFVLAARDAGILLYMLNMFAFGLYVLYDGKHE
jgi:Na+/melibiose symporter-like transporter